MKIHSDDLKIDWKAGPTSSKNVGLPSSDWILNSSWPSRYEQIIRHWFRFDYFNEAYINEAANFHSLH